MSTGIQSLAMTAPAVSLSPPLRFSAMTPPALSCLGTEMPLPGTFALSPATIDFSMFCKAEYATLSLALTVVPSILLKPMLAPTKAA